MGLFLSIVLPSLIVLILILIVRGAIVSVKNREASFPAAGKAIKEWLMEVFWPVTLLYGAISMIIVLAQAIYQQQKKS
jgi:TRAP-type C4-dicarboxylate transport system permease large subunit